MAEIIYFQENINRIKNIVMNTVTEIAFVLDANQIETMELEL